MSEIVDMSSRINLSLLEVPLPKYKLVATNFPTNHSFSEIVNFLHTFPNTDLNIHATDTMLCGVTWDDNNNWARYIITLYVGEEKVEHSDEESVSSGEQSNRVLEFNHTFGKSDIWITMFRILSAKFRIPSEDDAIHFKELRFWPQNYEDSPPEGEFFRMIISMSSDSFLESYTLSATYLTDYVKKVPRRLLFGHGQEIEMAALNFLSTNHPQCIRCVAQIANLFDFPKLDAAIRMWQPPPHVEFDELIWRDPAQKMKQVQQMKQVQKNKL